uniref:Uncharacterized protein n=1 Tax=Arundo donax TaxID=35708 RepID=A0A0A9A8E7_ARUDO
MGQSVYFAETAS